MLRFNSERPESEGSPPLVTSEMLC